MDGQDGIAGRSVGQVSSRLAHGNRGPWDVAEASRPFRSVPSRAGAESPCTALHGSGRGRYDRAPGQKGLLALPLRSHSFAAQTMTILAVIPFTVPQHLPEHVPASSFAFLAQFFV